MAAPRLVQADFSAGMRRDRSRDRLPQTAAWLLSDYIPDNLAPVRKRAGWTYHGAALASPATRVTALIFAEFTDAPRVVAIDEDAKLHAGAISVQWTTQQPPGSDWDTVGGFGGTWDVEETRGFDVGEAVEYPAASDTFYISEAPVTVGEPGVDPNWTEIDAWDSGTQYVADSVVKHDQSGDFLVYRTTIDFPGEPGIDPSWEIIPHVTWVSRLGDVYESGDFGWQLEDHRTSDPPAIGATWTRLSPWRGAWQTGAHYFNDDYAHRADVAYIANFTPGAATVVDAVLTRNPVFFNDYVILPPASSSDDVLKFDGTNSPSVVTDAPPGAYATVHRGRLVIALGDEVHFSDPGDEETWTVGNKIKVSAPVTGLASLYDRLLVWSDRRLEAITGSIPPAEVDTDMALRPVFEVGCSNNRSIVVHGDQAIFANADGIYATDGVTMNDLTQLGEVKQYWSKLVGDWDGDILPAGVYRGHYMVRVGSCLLVCRLVGPVFWTFTNVLASMFAHSSRIQEELFFGCDDEARIGKISPIWTGTADTDADGVDVEPVWESAFYMLGVPSLKAVHDLWLTYMLEGDDGDPVLEVGYTTSPHGAGYTPIGDLGMSGFARAKMVVNAGRQLGIAFRVAQSGVSMDTHIHSLELEVSDKEASRAT